MASSPLSTVLTPQVLDDMRDLWFQHFANKDSFVLPDLDEMKHWFGNKDMDEACVERFGTVLEAIKASGITTGEALLEAVPPREPLDWLSLVLLLDQVPRNCYRADAAFVAYTVFDPLAQQVTLAAMEQGIPDVLPEFRWSFARRMWFYLPLMHSEDPAEHDLATTKYASLQADMLSLIPGEASAKLEAENEHHREALRVVGAKADAAKMLGQVQVDFEKKHYDIIKQFGRYPHRNKTMGREMTAAEQEYLDNGGETFSG